MPFQFQCPTGHLLEADESQVGEQSQCPMCGQTFAIPAPAGIGPSPAPDVNPFSVGPPVTTPPAFGPPVHQPAVEPSPFILENAGGAIDPTGAMAGPKFLHIPCPNGHELEVPPEMLGQDVMCPHCGVQFLLREKDSVEAKRRKKEQLELKDYKAGKNWLMWAVIFVVLVLIGLGIMIGVNANG